MTALLPFPDGPPRSHRQRNFGGARRTALFTVLLAAASPSLLAYSGSRIAIDANGTRGVSRQSRSDQASAAIDSVYRRFSAAYDRLDADSVAVLYTEDALYLQPRGDDGRWRIHVDSYSSAPREPEDGSN